MGESILSQTVSDFKTEISHHLTPIINDLYKYNLDWYNLSAEILSRSNEEAVSFLESVGCTAVIPRTHFIPIREAIRFFNVDEKYMRSLLYRLGFSKSRVPDEILAVDIRDFFNKHGMVRFGKFRPIPSTTERNLVGFTYTDTGMQYITKASESNTLYSARILLATVPMIYRNRGRNNSGHNIAAIYNALIESEYTKEREFVRKDEVSEEQPSVSTTNSNTTLSKNELMAMIKQAVREVLTDVRVEVPATFTITT